MERIITPDEILEDGNSELSLRPQRINEYIGQDKVKERLNIFITAAKKRNEALDHVLLYDSKRNGWRFKNYFWTSN